MVRKQRFKFQITFLTTAVSFILSSVTTDLLLCLTYTGMYRGNQQPRPTASCSLQHPEDLKSIPMVGGDTSNVNKPVVNLFISGRTCGYCNTLTIRNDTNLRCRYPCTGYGVNNHFPEHNPIWNAKSHANWGTAVFQRLQASHFCQQCETPTSFSQCSLHGGVFFMLAALADMKWSPLYWPTLPSLMTNSVSSAPHVLWLF